jgi:RimJ/RimL family protein N-acetyltransferase
VSFELIRIEGKEWSEVHSADAYAKVFGEFRPGQHDSSDFALVLMNDKEPLGYIQFIEISKQTVYGQFGGAVESIRGTDAIDEGFSKSISQILAEYQRFEFRVENTNIKMLHLALKSGFKIFGVRSRGNGVFVDLYIEREQNG